MSVYFVAILSAMSSGAAKFSVQASCVARMVAVDVVLPFNVCLCPVVRSLISIEISKSERV